ncbi:MAG: molybdopterin molybdotransferase MoeA [Flavobacteriales bacterium]|nr:molybdopterin molybdotransferase MoeA [Flavobacteriales bacterium]
MISVKEAIDLVSENSSLLPGVLVELTSSLGYVLAEDVHSPIPHPPFNQSAMDGYAVGSFNKNEVHDRFKLVGEIKAGDSSTVSLLPGEAVRIFTGGMVPDGTMSVIMQEVVTANGSEITIKGDIKLNSHIRPLGEQIKKGQLALSKGTQLTPAGIGFLCGLGITHVTVYPQPKIGIIITGSELVQAGTPLLAGQIYESNSATIIAALRSTGFDVTVTETVEDDLPLTISTIKKMMAAVDVIILSGGISVGDYDHVGIALQKLGVDTIFYKVKQKPGKPIFFGKTSECMFFALPGNPSASLLCYYQYVLPAIRKMSGIESIFLEKKLLPLQSSYVKKGNRAHFLKAVVKGNEVSSLHGQSSSMLHTFAISNALVFIPEDKDEVKSGELVEVHLLP